MLSSQHQPVVVSARQLGGYETISLTRVPVAYRNPDILRPRCVVFTSLSLQPRSFCPRVSRSTSIPFYTVCTRLAIAAFIIRRGNATRVDSASMSTQMQGTLLDVLKKKMRQTKEEMEKYKDECEEYKKRLQVEAMRREEVSENSPHDHLLFSVFPRARRETPRARTMYPPSSLGTIFVDLAPTCASSISIHNLLERASHARPDHFASPRQEQEPSARKTGEFSEVFIEPHGNEYASIPSGSPRGWNRVGFTDPIDSSRGEPCRAVNFIGDGPPCTRSAACLYRKYGAQLDGARSEKYRSAARI